MTWNTELLLTEGGSWAESFDEARNNLSAARDQLLLCPQWSNSLIKAQFHGKAKPLGPKDPGLYIWLAYWEARQKRAKALFCGSIGLQSERGKGKDGRVIMSCFAINLLKGAWYNDQQMQLHYQVKSKQFREQDQLTPRQKHKKAAETELRLLCIVLEHLCSCHVGGQ